MKNIDFENCNNFRIRNKWIFSFCFIRWQILLMQKLEKRKIFLFLRLFSNYGQETSLCKADTSLKGTSTHLRDPSVVLLIEVPVYVISFSTHAGIHDVTARGGGTCHSGVSGDVPFSRVHFLPQNSRARYQF